MPLTLHLPFALLIAREARAFDMWAMLSMIITGPTHLVLAALTAHRARQLATGRIPLSPMKIYGACVAVSCLPFAIFVLPPVLVMLTGLALYPLIAWMEPLAARDRARAQAEALPRAIASLPRGERLPRAV